MTTTEQIKGIVEPLVRWGGIFDVDAKLIEISNEEEKTLLLILE
jgi:peptide chain release factor 2